MTNEKNQSTDTRRLKTGTMVVNTKDGERGWIVQVNNYRRNYNAQDYVVDTAYGREVWDARDLFVPEQQQLQTPTPKENTMPTPTKPNTANEDSTDVMREALRDHMSPEAVAAIGMLLQTADNYSDTVDPATLRQIRWFRELCAEMTEGVDCGL